MKAIKTATGRKAEQDAEAAERRRNEVKLTMYDKSPTDDVTLEDFESFAVDRLRGAGAAEDGGKRGRLASASLSAAFSRRPCLRPLNGHGALSGPRRAAPCRAELRRRRAVLKGIEMGLSRGLKPDEMEARCPHASIHTSRVTPPRRSA